MKRSAKLSVLLAVLAAAALAIWSSHKRLAAARRVEAMIDGLGSADPAVREPAARALVGEPGRSVADRIISRLCRVDEPVFGEKARAVLLDIGEPAIEPIVLALAKRLSFLDELTHPGICAGCWDDELGRVRRLAAELVDQIGPGAYPYLVKALSSGSGELRSAAAFHLGRLKDPRAVAPLSKLLLSAGRGDPQAWHHGQGGEYHIIAEALAAFGDEGVRPLLEALRHENAEVRWSAAFALGSTKSPLALEPLFGTLLGDPDECVRGAAACGLGRQGDTRALPVLLAALKDSSCYARACVVEALGDLADPSCVGPLIEFYEMVSKVSPTVVEVRPVDVVSSLGRIKSDRAVEFCIGALQSTDSAVRCCATRALGAIGPERAAGPLMELIAVETDSNVTVVAAEVLESIDQPGADMAIAAALQRGGKSGSRYLRHSMIRLLAGTEDDSAIEVLSQFIFDPDDEVACACAAALERSPNAKAAAVVEEAAGTDADVRLVARDYQTAIEDGWPGSEVALVIALERYGDLPMARALWYCQNSALRSSAAYWAERHDVADRLRELDPCQYYSRWGRHIESADNH